MELSWIQRYALLVLLRKETAQVKDLTPPDVAANLFSYHLKGLEAAGIIEKAARGTYKLTTDGQKFAGTFSTNTETKMEEIKTVVMLYAKKDGKYLMFRWSRQPYIGKVTLLHDRLPFGKSLEDGLRSATEDKLGKYCPTAYVTSVLIKVLHEAKLVSHMHAIVYSVDLPDSFESYKSRNGEAILVNVGDTHMMSGVDDLIRLIEKKPHQQSEIVLEY